VPSPEVSWRRPRSCRVVLQGSRGGVDLPGKDIDRVKSHVAKYYAKMSEDPPWK